MLAKIAVRLLSFDLSSLDKIMLATKWVEQETGRKVRLTCGSKRPWFAVPYMGTCLGIELS